MRRRRRTAPRIGLIHSSVPLAPLFGTQGARFDPQKFHWIGSMDRSDGPCTAWHTSPAKTWADLLQTPFIVGSSGVGSQMDIYPAMLNKLFGTKIKVIGGYKDGASIFHAMEREEIHGRCGPQLTAIRSLRPQWFTEHKIIIPIMVSERRSRDFPDAPSVMEFAKDEPTRQQIRLLIVTQDLDRPVLAPPGVPAGAGEAAARRLQRDHERSGLPRRHRQAAAHARLGRRRGGGQDASPAPMRCRPRWWRPPRKPWPASSCADESERTGRR